MKRLLRFLTISTLFVFAAGPAAAELVPVYGPVYVAKTRSDSEHKGKEAKFTFTAPMPGSGLIVVKNGGDSGKRSRAASAEIELNGTDIAKRKDFNKNVERLEFEVQLLAENELEVEVKSCKGCELEITVMGEKPAPPPTRTVPTRTIP